MSTSGNVNNLTCLVCDEMLANYMADLGGIQPDAGTAFRTQGHYGSTITDFMDGTTTIVCICDGCLAEGIVKGAVWFNDKKCDR